MTSDRRAHQGAAHDLLSERVTVLLTSVGNEAVHGFVDDLRARAPHWELIGTDIRTDAAGLYRCDRGYIVPRLDDAEFIPALETLIARHAVDVVYPLSTRDQDFFCRPEPRAALAGTPLVLSEPAAVAATNRKIALYEAIGRDHPMVPEYRSVEDAADALSALQELVSEHGAALLKADGGTGGQGMICAGNPSSDPAPASDRRWWPLERIEALVRAGQTELPVPPELAILVEARRDESWPRLAVEYLPGDEYSVDVLSDNGEPLAGVVRKRSAAQGGIALAAEVVDEADVLDAAYEVARRTGLSYVSNIQFRRDARGVPRLMEVNPRIPGTISLTVAAGLNLPLGAICLALGARLPMPEPVIGRHVTRYYGSVFTDELAYPWRDDRRSDGEGGTA